MYVYMYNISTCQNIVPPVLHNCQINVSFIHEYFATNSEINNSFIIHIDYVLVSTVAMALICWKSKLVPLIQYILGSLKNGHMDKITVEPLYSGHCWGMAFCLLYRDGCCRGVSSLRFLVHEKLINCCLYRGIYAFVFKYKSCNWAWQTCMIELAVPTLQNILSTCNIGISLLRTDSDVWAIAMLKTRLPTHKAPMCTDDRYFVPVR